jgi:hypothetical protein
MAAISPHLQNWMHREELLEAEQSDHWLYVLESDRNKHHAQGLPEISISFYKEHDVGASRAATCVSI